LGPSASSIAAAKEIKADHVAQDVQKAAVHKLEGDQLVEPSLLEARGCSRQKVRPPGDSHSHLRFARINWMTIAHHKAGQQYGGHGPVLPLRRAHI
jgi:hypothetical protein